MKLEIGLSDIAQFMLQRVHSDGVGDQACCLVSGQGIGKAMEYG